MTRLKKTLFIGLPLAVAGVVIKASLPQMIRYMRIRRM